MIPSWTAPYSPCYSAGFANSESLPAQAFAAHPHSSAVTLDSPLSNACPPLASVPSLNFLLAYVAGASVYNLFLVDAPIVQVHGSGEFSPATGSHRMRGQKHPLGGSSTLLH